MSEHPAGGPRGTSSAGTREEAPAERGRHPTQPAVQPTTFPTPQWVWCLFGTWFLFYLVWSLITVVYQRGLVADGAWFFIVQLKSASVTTFDVPRFFAHVLTQWATVVGINLGLTDLNWLRFLHSFGLFYLGPLSMCLCWCLVPERERLALIYPVLSLCTGSFNASLHAISESHVIAAILWPVAFFVRYGEWSTSRHALLGGTLSIATLLAYESMAFFGLPLVALSGWRMLRAERRWQCVLWAGIGLWFLAGSFVAIHSILWPRDIASKGALVVAAQQLDGLHRGAFNPPTLISAAGLFAFLLAWLATARFRRLGYGVAHVFGAFALAVVWRTVHVPEVLSWDRAYRARYLAIVVPAALLLFFVANAGRGVRWSYRLGPVVSVVAVLAFAQVVWQGVATYEWSKYVGHLKTRLTTERGLIAHSPSPFHSFATPSLSIVLAPGGHVRAIAETSPQNWQPFNPRDPRQLPDLRRYGITYDWASLRSSDHRSGK